MSTIENTHSGTGSRTDFDFTFEYLKQADVKAEIDNVAETGFTFLNATELRFNTAPANNTTVRIYRDTNVDTLQAEFFPGSSIKAEDLNNNFTQNNFATQESKLQSTKAPQALTNSQTAISTANSAVATANSALAAVNEVVAAKVYPTPGNLPQTAVAAAADGVTDGTYADIINTSHIVETQVTDLPFGFTGSSDTTVRAIYNSANLPYPWMFVSYTIADPDDRYYTKTLANATFVDTADVGVTVQSYDADTAKLDVVQTFSADQTFSGATTFSGNATFNAAATFSNDVSFASTQSFPKAPLSTVTADHTLAAGDAGNTLVRTAGDITFPANGPAPGDLITIYNDGSTDCNLSRFVPDPTTPAVLQPVILKAGGTTTADFVLKPGGIVTVLCLVEGDALATAAKYVISGTGVL